MDLVMELARREGSAKRRKRYASLCALHGAAAASITCT